MPLGMCGVEAPGIIRLTPCLPPACSNQQDVAFLNLYILRLCGVLQILGGDPVVGRQRVSALKPGDVEQHPAPDHLDDARGITLRGASRFRRRQVVVQGVLAIDMPKGVEMRPGVVVHKGEAGGTLLPLCVELPGFRRDAIIPVIFQVTCIPTRAGVITRGTSALSSSPRAYTFPCFTSDAAFRTISGVM